MHGAPTTLSASLSVAPSAVGAVTVSKGRSRCSVLTPKPFTRTSSATVRKGLRCRCSRILAAFAAPIPGSRCSSSLLAVLRLTIPTNAGSAAAARASQASKVRLRRRILCKTLSLTNIRVLRMPAYRQ